MLSFTGELGWAGCLQVGLGPGAGSQQQRCPPGPASPLGSRGQLEQARRRRETRCELAALETDFNECLGTSAALLRAEILRFTGLGEEEEGSSKMARAVCRVTR